MRFDAEIGIILGDPEEMLGKLIENERFGHLIVGAAGHSRLRSLFSGSTSLKIMRTCGTPIRLVK